MHSKNGGYLLAIPPVWVRANLGARRKVVVDIAEDVITIRPAYLEEAENDVKN